MNLLYQGYRAPKAFIAAQSPMHDTADDFWAIVYDKKVSIIVLLCNFEENGQVGSNLSTL